MNSIRIAAVWHIVVWFFLEFRKNVHDRKIVYDEISKTNFEKLQGSDGKNKLLENIKNEFNAYLDSKKLDPIIFGVHYKKFAITTRGN